MGDSDYSRVAQAIQYLESHAAEQPSLATLAGHIGLSEFHFQRLFKRWAGVSPKDFLGCLTLQRAKGLLGDSRTLLDASLELGLSGPSRLHDLFLKIEAMTPGEFKQGGLGLAIRWGAHGTPFGEALFAATDRGLCGLSFLGEAPLEAELQRLRARWPRAELREDPARTAPLAAEAAARMQGGPRRPLALVLAGTPFQVKRWEALLASPEGAAATYQDLARRIGAPGASRAVGTALGQNPIGYLIPCHRVIRASGAIGEYHWGRVRKQALLGVEGARALARAKAS